MDLRFQELQQQYPALTLDVVLVATHRPFMTSGSLRYTIFNCEEQEIVMLTRGRRCTSECTTVFVDDYRYERNLLQTNIVDWYFFIAMMRGGAQGYFWARLVLLYVAAFIAAEAPDSGGQFWHSRIMYAIVIVFKIPFQVIVYSSPLPVAAYAVALLLDGNFMDIYLDSFWSSLEGATNFEFVAFLNSAVTQMRTVWLMALLVDLMVFVARKPSNGSEEKIPGVRGLVISFTSAMTVVGPYKHTFFRNSKVVTAIRSPHAGQNLDVVQSGPQWYFNGSTYLFGDSMTMLLLCIAIVAAVAVTDIPRTGLGVRNLLEYYPVPFMPSTAVRFGPVDYPITHIWRVDNSTDDVSASETFVGLKGVQTMSAVRAWPYQHDTISVGLRGAVELLNVTEFPDFLLYKGRQATNPDTLIGLSTIFTMLDAFMTTARAELLREDNTYSTLRFATKHNWIDRLHHYVVRFASKNPAWRVHSLHVVSIPRKAQSLAICSNAGNTKRSSLRPRFCNHPGIWKCPHPLDPSLPAVRLWDHMDLRLQALKQRYPDLELDVVLLSSQRFSTTSGVMRSTYYNYEALEVALLTRGRRCVELETNSSSEPKVVTCTTVFVDDHRYERDTVQTNVIDWYGIISVLRGGAQAYVWIRLALLIYGASVAARQEAAGCPQSQPRSVCLSVVAIVFRIPFEVIVYSSLLPVTGYVVALLLDGSFADIFLDSYWTAVGGTINIGLVTFLRTTAVQMRNVWLLALVVTVVVFAVKKTRGHWSDGTPGIRGLVISFTSTLTICGPYKRTFYRDTNITNVFRLADESQTMDIIHCNPAGLFNASTYIFDDSAIMLLFCIVVVVGLVMVVKALGFLAPRRNWALGGIGAEHSF
ncbi:uncharacterized protein KRP23_13805 [Phytophthora ramorum]|uniref:uncharacterized protein n=1 Tax=Phytophthora ramorum TaxID=164328 RepID=UPI0030A9E0A4|nr:hypothetical protein KRP23_13805 [Phytophthora ramorum]